MRDRVFRDPVHGLIELRAGMFFTIWYGVLDRRDWTLDYASAGHHPSFVWSPDGTPLQALQTPNLVIGAMDGVDFDAGRTRLRSGQKLYIFSDGVFEGHDAQGDAPDGWQVYAWRPATMNDESRLPPMRSRNGQPHRARMR